MQYIQNAIQWSTVKSGMHVHVNIDFHIGSKETIEIINDIFLLSWILFKSLLFEINYHWLIYVWIFFPLVLILTDILLDFPIFEFSLLLKSNL